MTNHRIEFVFGEVNDQLKLELRAFWGQHGNAYQEELRSFRIASRNSDGLKQMDLRNSDSFLSLQPKQMDLLKKPISRQPAAISRDQTGRVVENCRDH